MNRFTRYLVERVLWTIPVLLGVSLVTFAIIHLTPGDPARYILGRRASAEAVQQLRVQLGLNKPIYVQYIDYLGDVLHGNFGQSFQTKQDVMDVILARLPYTLQLTVSGLIVALVVSIPIGIVSAIHEGDAVDHTSRVGALLGISIPGFWFGLLLILFIAVPSELFPIYGMTLITEDLIGGITSTLLPAIALGTAQAALLTRLLRGGILDELQKGYVRAAQAYGIASNEIRYVYVLKNAILPTITVVGLQLGALLGGAVIIEQVFSVPGIGRLAIRAIYTKDYPVIQGVTLLIAVTFVIANLIVDLLYTRLDPRIGLGGNET